MSSTWKSTMLLRVAEHAYVRTEPTEPTETDRLHQDLVRCPHCHRITDWLIAAAENRVDFACRCGHRWQIATTLQTVVALADYQPIEPKWTSLDDACHALGFARAAHAPSAPRRLALVERRGR